MFWPVVVILVANLQVQAVITDPVGSKGYPSVTECRARLAEILQGLAQMNAQIPTRIVSARCDQRA